MLPRTRGPIRTAAVVAVLVLSLAGCGDDDSKTSSQHRASPTPSAVSTPPTPTASHARRGGPLLSAGEVPPLGNGEGWVVVSTTHKEPRSFGTCQRFGILAIGAERVVVRRFRPADTGESPDLSSEMVATFPDAMTARRAYSVLESWHQECAALLRRYTKPEVGELEPVPVGKGQAGWYLLTYGPVAGQPGKVFLDAQGTALVGKQIAMLTMVRVGTRNASSPPMREALTAAAARLL